jgi:hypothetical protein
MTITDSCVSPSTGTLSPDLRVNYAYGMVLGLDEFLQEQLHRLTHGWLHDRALHGYGTASGLAVTVTPTDGAQDFTVHVGTGVAVDQWGREIVIRCDQCARIGAWLGVQEQADPGVIGRHLGPSGELTVYVTASYAECLDALVPIPGQPCSSSEQSMVPSRIRDAWDIELSWDRPASVRWDTDRRLARLLAGVEVVAGLSPADSDEDLITIAVLDLVDRAADGPDDLDPELDPSTPAWRLPAEEAADALDRIFTVWVTRVRPELALDLVDLPATGDPGGADPSAAILLASITFVPASPFDPAVPAIVACDEPDETGRPYLLGTQLIQELRHLGGSATIAPEPTTVATLTATIGETGLTLVDAWFHLDDPVRLPDTVTVTDEDGGTWDFATSPSSPAAGFSDRWTLTGPDQGVAGRDGLQVAVHLPLDLVEVGGAGTTLREVADDAETALLDRTDTEVLAYGIVRRPVVIPDPPETPPGVTIPSTEFVTLVSENSDGTLQTELWFHLQPRGRIGETAVAAQPVFRVFDDTTGDELRMTVTGPSPWTGNVWRMAGPSPYDDQFRPVYLRLVFLADKFVVRLDNGDELLLKDWIEKAPANFEGWDPDAGQVVAFVRNPGIVEGLRPTLEPFDSVLDRGIRRLSPLRRIQP